MKKSYLFLALGLAFLIGFAHAAPISYQPIAYQTLAIGSRSGCAVPAKMIITSQAEWERVWAKHISADEMKMSAPPIDWNNKAVVVLLGGQSRGGSLEVQHISQSDGVTTIYYIAAKDGNSNVQPFHFALINAPTGPVRFADGNTDCSVCAAIRTK